jgi:hypothetical protein
MRYKNNLPLVICLIGYKRDGKTTSMEFLKESIAKQTEEGLVIDTINFADPMKDIVSNMFNIPLDILDDLKNREDANPLKITDPIKKYNFPEHVSIRRVLQKLGEGVNTLGDGTWTRALYKKIKTSPADVIIVGDLRYEHEFNYLQKRLKGNMFVVRVSRTDKPADTHSSETSLDSIPFDLKINNKGTMAELKDTCCRISLFFLGILGGCYKAKK